MLTDLQQQVMQGIGSKYLVCQKRLRCLQAVIRACGIGWPEKAQTGLASCRRSITLH